MLTRTWKRLPSTETFCGVIYYSLVPSNRLFMRITMQTRFGSITGLLQRRSEGDFYASNTSSISNRRQTTGVSPRFLGHPWLRFCWIRLEHMGCEQKRHKNLANGWMHASFILKRLWKMSTFDYGVLLSLRSEFYPLFCFEIYYKFIIHRIEWVLRWLFIPYARTPLSCQ